MNERLGLSAFYRKYGRKAFPVHSTFFLGEMALFAFVILVADRHLPRLHLRAVERRDHRPGQRPARSLRQRSADRVDPGRQPLPQYPPLGRPPDGRRRAAALLRIFFTGTYRKPREINWVIGLVAPRLDAGGRIRRLRAPYDAYAVTATGIGYSIARSIPWVGPIASELFFGGAFPTLGSLARLYTIHIFIVPALLATVIGAHLLIMLKQKHTQPGYARALAEPGKVLGVPLWPYQAILAGQSSCC